MKTRKSVLVCVTLMCAGAISCGSHRGAQGAAGSSASKSPVAPAGTMATPQAASGAAGTTSGTTRPAQPTSASAAGGSAAKAAPTAAAPAAGSGSAEPTPDAGASAPGNEDPAKDTDSTGALPAVTDFSMNGPYEAVSMGSMGPSNNYTVFYPKDLAASGRKNPIVGWMSGGGTDPSLYPLLPLLATHGFVVVASNTIPGIGDEANLGKEIIAGIDWAIAENDRDGSVFYQKLDTAKLASTGYSMGSLATFQIAGDERLTTTVHISGGNMAPEPIHNLHAPAAFLCGIPGDDSCDILSDTCDIAAANCDKDFAAATTPVFYANFSSGHLGILTPPYQAQIQTEVVAWLRWQLLGDAALQSRFVGDQCGVCKDDRWKVQQKGLN